MKRKPVLLFDMFPSRKVYGKFGFILTVIAYIFVFLLIVVTQDIILIILAIFMFILGGFSGREFEKHRDKEEEIEHINEVRNKEKEKNKKNKQTL